MTKENDEFARKLTGYLDRGSAELKAGTAYRLQLARAEALARLTDPKRQTAAQAPLALAGAGTGTLGGGGSGLRSSVRLGIGILLIVFAAFGYQQWQAYQQLQDLEETDAAILSSDLPIDAYLDQGFQNWLRTVAD